MVLARARRDCYALPEYEVHDVDLCNVYYSIPFIPDILMFMIIEATRKGIACFKIEGIRNGF